MLNSNNISLLWSNHVNVNGTCIVNIYVYIFLIKISSLFDLKKDNNSRCDQKLSISLPSNEHI